MNDIFRYISEFQNPSFWQYIIIHHSLTKDGILADWNAIRNYHVNVKKWDDIGYHFGIEIVDGKLVYQIGRRLDYWGAHTPGKATDGKKINDVALGICVVGNYDVKQPSISKYYMTANLCKQLMQKFQIPERNILPHWAFSEKTCPGEKFNLLELRELIRTLS